MHTALGKLGAPLRWAGSKRQALRHLSLHWHNEYSRYVEPFAGSASLFFHIKPSRALLADKNSELINAYSVLRRAPRELHRRLSAIPVNQATYYAVRGYDQNTMSALGRAVRFLYLNRCCFNGLYRTNRRGQFNVPYAKNRIRALLPLDAFLAWAQLLAGADLRTWDFGTTLARVGKGDFVYLDPPYAVRSRELFNNYGPHSFDEADLARLIMHLDRIHERGAAFLLSYADCPQFRALVGAWKVRTIRVRRNIAGFVSARRLASELLVTNVDLED